MNVMENITNFAKYMIAKHPIALDPNATQEEFEKFKDELIQTYSHLYFINDFVYRIFPTSREIGSLIAIYKDIVDNLELVPTWDLNDTAHEVIYYIARRLILSTTQYEYWELFNNCNPQPNDFIRLILDNLYYEMPELIE